MAGEGYLHGNAQDMLWRALAGVLSSEWEALPGRRIDIDADTELYLDLIVQRAGRLGQRRSPQTVSLIVEVSETTLARDRDVRGPRYAAAGFQEFWIYEAAHRRV